MQDIVKRYFWVLGAVTVMVCSLFAAKAAGHIIEAKFLGDPKTAPKVAPIQQATPVTAKPAHDKNGLAIETRNIFCSECTPPVPTGPVSSDPSSISMTTLPLSLLATNIGATETD